MLDVTELNRMLDSREETSTFMLTFILSCLPSFLKYFIILWMASGSDIRSYMILLIDKSSVMDRFLSLCHDDDQV